MIAFTKEQHIYFSFCHNGKIYQFFVSSWAQYRKASSRRKRIEEEKQSPKGADVCRTPLLLYMVASINCLGSQRAAFIEPSVALVCFYLCNIKPSCLSLLKKGFDYFNIEICQYICCIKYNCSFRIQPPLTAWIVFNKPHWQLQPHTITCQSSNTF